MIPKRALLLSAGRGERLRPLTDDLPKTMVPVGGRPLLEYHVVLLHHLGIREIAVNLHHRPDVVRSYFGDGAAWGVRITYSLEEELLGTAGAAKRLEEFLGAGRFLVVYGDNLFDYDLKPLLTLHEQSGAVTTMGLFEGPDPTAGGIAALGRDGRVTRFLEKPRPQEVWSRLVSAGIYVMEPEVLQLIPSDRCCDLGREILPALIESGMPVYGLQLEGTLLGVDTPDLYRAACLSVEAGHLHHPLTSGRGLAGAR